MKLWQIIWKTSLRKNVVSGVFLSGEGFFMQKAGRKLYRLYAETEEFLREIT